MSSAINTGEQPYPTWSYSRLGSIEKCGVLHEFVYLKGIRIPPAITMIRGKATHKSRELAMYRKLDSPEAPLLTEEECAERARDEVVTGFEGELTLRGAELEKSKRVLRDETIDETVKLAVLDRLEFHDALNPVEVEARWEWKPDWLPVPIIGYADLVCAENLSSDEAAQLASIGVAATNPGHIIRDLKTGKRKPKGIEHADGQLTVYAMLYEAKYGAPPRAVGFDQLVALKREPDADRRVSVRRPIDYTPMLKRFARAQEVVERGAFAPAPPDAWWCSKDWCGFFDVCPYATRPVSLGSSGT